MTSPNPKGLAAYLETDPEEVAGWVEKAPLRLVALALSDLENHTGRSGQLESKLSQVLSEAPNHFTWNAWWDRVRPGLTETPYFLYKNPNYTFRRSYKVEDIPEGSLPPSRKSAKNAGSRKKSTSNRRVSEDIKALRETHAANLKEQRESHAAELKQQRETYDAELRQQRASHAADSAQQRESYAADLKRLKESHELSLERWQREEERLYNRINTLIADKAALREESRLEIRQEMLLRVGDIIQRGYQTGKTPEARLDELMEILPYALRDGGAQPLGTVGEIVPYDPRLHHSPEKIAIGGPVRLTAPGVVVIGGSFGDKIILKANVTRESEAT